MLLRQSTRGSLVTKEFQLLGRRADETQTRLSTGARKVGPLAQETLEQLLCPYLSRGKVRPVTVLP